MSKYTFVDSEISSRNQILDLGAIKDDGAEFHGSNTRYFSSFVEDSIYIVGHNIFKHDLLYIKKLLPVKYTAIDTLLWSPILFPNKPYHRLVKDDKIDTEDVNNPLSDAKKCRDLYYDEVSKFNSLPQELKDIFGELLSKNDEFSGFLKSVNWNHRMFTNIKSLIIRQFDGLICTSSNISALVRDYPIELAYALALISAEDKKSITPGWVLHQYPQVEYVIHELRSKNCHSSTCTYCSKTFKAKQKLQEYFGYEDFRTFEGENLQEQAVNLALERKSLLAIFPTGGGKSLTFQLPALIDGETIRGLTIVISPLQSLMKDQVDNLEKKTIVGATTINGLLTPVERSENIELVRNGTASILYIAPESLRSKTIEKLLLSREISRIVIDEAHCFSSWGHDFRVDYLFIADFIKALQEKKKLKTNIPISCFTATAKPKVISDITDYFRNNLGVELRVLASKATRTNLTYKVLKKTDDNDKYQTLRELLIENQCPTIVYVARTKETTDLAARLNNDGIPTLAFHGQMDRTQKIENQNKFMRNDAQVIVATSAFGMGVDKSDVKLVIHYDISDSLENYVQEAGRAGRDQNIQADCYVLFNENDLDKHFLLLNQTKITMNEIQQVWNAIKSMTIKNRPTVSASALEIARRAGWDDNVHDIESRVRSAVSALEQAGYIKRKMNSPRVFATGVLTKNFFEACNKIDNSNRFQTEEEKNNAKKIIKRIISARSTTKTDSDAESRVDYISDVLGIPRLDVENLVNSMKEEGILADSQDLNAYIKNNEETKTTNVIAKFSKLEKYMIDHIFQYKGSVDLKEFNDKAIKDGVKDSTIKNIRTILFYWSLRNLIKCKRFNNIYEIETIATVEKIAKTSEIKLVLANRIAEYLFKKAKKETKEELVEFSLIELLDAVKDYDTLLESEYTFTRKDIEDALLYLSKIEAINLDGGFIVLYNMMNIERLVLDNKIKYKKEDYKELENFYKSKTQQIHIVGEFANMMLRNYQDALTYVKDYFALDYEIFLKKYFKGKQRTGEILRNITPAKYDLLFGDLSEKQKQIIDDDETQFISVIAGPGSGKTKLLVHKLASLLLLEDIKSEQLLMLTFSRMAAREFKKRLLDLVGTAANYVDIKTFHSYCFDLLGKLGNEDEFDNVVKTATDMIESGEVEEDKISKIVLVIDEAQDMDETEYNLVKALIKRNPEMRVIAVGDDDQNIYEFRGSDSKYLENIYLDHVQDGSKKYEMVANYRSDRKIINVANLYAKTLMNRLKTEDIVSMSRSDGMVTVTEYIGPNLEEPVCEDFFKKGYDGTTAILTQTNDSALKVVGILVKKGIKAKLIQSDDNINLFNLIEFRTFINLISKCSSPVVDNDSWIAAKEILKEKFSKSNILTKVLSVINTFANENKVKYKNDFISFVSESAFDDFEKAESNEVIVSTIHKAKGKEFDNVFVLLDSNNFKNDEEKRKVYVGLTRAKSNLHIHIYGDAFRWMKSRTNIDYCVDSKEYEEPTEMELQLGFHDVFLSYFKQFKQDICNLRSGQFLGNYKEYLIFDKKFILRFSRETIDRLQILNNKGYRIYKSEIRYISAWVDKENPEEEIAVILPNIYLKKDDENITTVKGTEEAETLKEEISKETNLAFEKEIEFDKKIVSIENLSSEEIDQIKQTQLFKDLKRLRMILSKEKDREPFVIASDRTLADIVLKLPLKADELSECYRFGPQRTEEFGNRFIELLSNYVNSRTK